jgi:hypothetical protein
MFYNPREYLNFVLRARMLQKLVHWTRLLQELAIRKGDYEQWLIRMRCAKCSTISAKQLITRWIKELFYVHCEVRRSVHSETRVCNLARTVTQHNYAVGVEKHANKEAAILLSGPPTAFPLRLRTSAATRYPYCCEQRAASHADVITQSPATGHATSRQPTSTQGHSR